MNLRKWSDEKLAARIQLYLAMRDGQAGASDGKRGVFFRKMLEEASRRVGSWLDEKDDLDEHE